MIAQTILVTELRLNSDIKARKYLLNSQHIFGDGAEQLIDMCLVKQKNDSLQSRSSAVATGKLFMTGLPPQFIPQPRTWPDRVQSPRSRPSRK
jgi:hypothetical protein